MDKFTIFFWMALLYFIILIFHIYSLDKLLQEMYFVSSVLLCPCYEDLRKYPYTHVNWESVHKQNFWIKI